MPAAKFSAANPLGVMVDDSTRYVDLTALTLALTASLHGDRVVRQNLVGGGTITLPASSGSGVKYAVWVVTTVTSNLVIQVANALDVLRGVVGLTTDIAGTVIPTSATTDTITMNGSTTGGISGTYLEFEDIALGFWKLSGNIITTGTEATPFSAAV